MGVSVKRRRIFFEQINFNNYEILAFTKFVAQRKHFLPIKRWQPLLLFRYVQVTAYRTRKHAPNINSFRWARISVCVCVCQWQVKYLHKAKTIFFLFSLTNIAEIYSRTWDENVAMNLFFCGGFPNYSLCVICRFRIFFEDVYELFDIWFNFMFQARSNDYPTLDALSVWWLLPLSQRGGVSARNNRFHAQTKNVKVLAEEEEEKMSITNE